MHVTLFLCCRLQYVLCTLNWLNVAFSDAASAQFPFQDDYKNIRQHGMSDKVT